MTEEPLRIADVIDLSLAEVEARAGDPEAAYAVHRATWPGPRNNLTTPWVGTNSPIGTWRLCPSFGEWSVLVLLDPWDVRVVEDEAEGRAHPSFTYYVEWLRQGLTPPAVEALLHADGYLVTLNRRRTLAARDVGVDIPAWFDTTLPSGRPRWQNGRLGHSWQQQAALMGWDAVLA